MPMRIGIIGAGGAGLAAAWLLQDSHDVTLYERQDYLGGHAQTIYVEQDGERCPVDVGFEFFMDGMFPRFLRLLARLGVPVARQWGTVTLYEAGGRSERLVPPWRNGRVVWPALTPRALCDLLAYRRLLDAAGPFVDAADPFVTIDEFLASQRLAPAFRDRFVYPFLLAQWCVDLDEFKTFSAYNVLKYSVAASREGNLLGARFSEVPGGIGAYAEALGRALGKTTVYTGARIENVTRAGGRYRVAEARGRVLEFDHLVLATNAAEAAALLADVPEAEPARRVLGRVEYFPTVIAVHGDRRLMPGREAHWSVVNTRWDGRHSQNTIWKPWRSRTPVFRSWITFDERPPDFLHRVVTYRHGKINRAYFQAQLDLRGLQGREHLWFAGLYTHDIDCHESALVSAIKIAEVLAPQAPGLAALAGNP